MVTREMMEMYQMECENFKRLEEEHINRVDPFHVNLNKRVECILLKIIESIDNNPSCIKILENHGCVLNSIEATCIFSDVYVNRVLGDVVYFQYFDLVNLRNCDGKIHKEWLYDDNLIDICLSIVKDEVETTKNLKEYDVIKSGKLLLKELKVKYEN